MSNSRTIPENRPWRVDPEVPEHIIDEQGDTVVISCVTFQENKTLDKYEQLVRARRITAMHNACTNVPLAVLRPGLVNDLFDLVHYLRAFAPDKAQAKVDAVIMPPDPNPCAEMAALVVGRQQFADMYLGNWDPTVCHCACHTDMSIARNIKDGFCRRCADFHEDLKLACRCADCGSGDADDLEGGVEVPVVFEDTRRPIEAAFGVAPSAIERRDVGLNLTERAPTIYDERCEKCGSHTTSDAMFGCTPDECANTQLMVIA